MERRPLRVMLVLGDMNLGGIESVVTGYDRAIDHARVSFDYVAEEGSSVPQRGEIEARGEQVTLIPRYSHLPAYVKALRAHIRAVKPDVVHAHCNTMSVFPLYAAWREGVPVRIVHNHTCAHRGEAVKTAAKLLLRPFARLYATDCMACGRDAARWMFGDRAVDAGEVTLLHNALNVDAFAFSPEVRAAKRRELGIAEHALVLGHIGRICAQKNQSFLLEACAPVLQSRPEAVLLVVGEGGHLPALQQEAVQLGVAKQVLFTGARQDAAMLYSAMDAFLLPSLYEGFPVTGCEAQASGLPCFLSDMVTSAAKLLDATVFLPLDKAAWTAALMDFSPATNRELDRAAFAAHHLILSEEADNLCRFYETAVKRKDTHD